MKKMNWFLVVIMLLGACFASCTKNNNGDSWIGKSVTVDCDPYNAWSYFSFKEGKTVKTLNVKSMEGAVAGVYYGDLNSNTLIKNTDSLLMVINEGIGDTVVISFPACKIGGMSGTETTNASFSLKAIAKKEGNIWKISSEKSVVAMEKENATSTDYYMSINGTIGTTKNADFNLALYMNVKAMEDGGMQMNMGGDLVGKSTGKTYGVDGDETSFEWDLAFHRYDIKTNGGAAIMLQTSESFTSDVDGEVMVDMSGMMSGFVGYQPTKVNEVLAKWVTATPTGSMPPYTYKINGKVFVVKTADGKYAKLRFTDMSDATGKNEAATFDYEYPLK